MNISFAPAIPLPILIAIGIAIAALIIAVFWFRLRGRFLRTAAACLLLAALANPIIHQDETEKLTDIAVIIVDHTDSQKITHRIEQTDKAAADLRKTIELLGNTEVRVTTLTSSMDEQGGTRAFTALSRAVSDIPASRYAGAIMITDGEVHDVPNATGLAALPAGRSSKTPFRVDQNDAVPFSFKDRAGRAGDSRVDQHRVQQRGLWRGRKPLTPAFGDHGQGREAGRGKESRDTARC